MKNFRIYKYGGLAFVYPVSDTSDIRIVLDLIAKKNKARYTFEHVEETLVKNIGAIKIYDPALEYYYYQATDDQAALIKLFLD